MSLSGNLAYDVLVNDPPPQDGVLPNGEPKRFSPQASTLIYGSEDAVLTDPVGAPFYAAQGGATFGSTFCTPIPPEETSANPNF